MRKLFSLAVLAIGLAVAMPATAQQTMPEIRDATSEW